MPWELGDVEKHIKGLSDSQKNAWVKIANSSLSSCLSEGKDQSFCEGYAIRVASAKVKGIGESNKCNCGDVNIAEVDWDVEYVNNLPDSAFAFVESGDKDDEGKTKPRSLRHFPYKNKNGEIDLPHLRNALTRAPQSEFGAKAMPRLKSAAQQMEIGEYSESLKNGEGYFQSVVQIEESFLKNEKYKPNDEKREVVLPMLMEGWGNQVDKNYYSPKAIAESASYLMAKRKMYLNHPKPGEERDIRAWAGSIQETWVDEMPNGKHVAMGRVKILDDWLWNRFKAAPTEIGTSVLGAGKSIKQVVEGKEANMIESIEYIKSCDFVDYPGNTPFGMVYFVESQKEIDDIDIKSKKEEKEMKIEEITLSMIKEGRPEIVAEIEQAVEEVNKKKISELETKIQEQDKINLELKKKIDESEIKEKIAAKKDLVAKALKESKLPETAQTDVFKEILMKCEEVKSIVDGKEAIVTIDEQIKTLIDDRLILIGVKPIKDMGKGKNSDDKTEVQEAINEGIFGIKKEVKK